MLKMDVEANKNENSGLVHIRLITKQPQYAVADTPLAIPASTSVDELNTIVNNLIQETHVAEPANIDFDFLILQEIVTDTIKNHLELKDLSTEQVIEVEYIERLSAPKPQDCHLHDDWVASLDTREGLILSGAYDGTVNVWNQAGDAIVSLSVGHEVLGNANSIKAVAWATYNDNLATFISGGQDQTVYLHKWDRKTNKTELVVEYKGHERAVQSLATSLDRLKYASVGWDGFVKIWSLDEPTLDAEPVSKKSKKTIPDGVVSKTPDMTMKGHTDCVTCVRWYSASEIITSSFDHTLRLWDVQEGGMKHQMAGNKAFLSCDWSTVNGLIVATAADKHVRIYDPRSNEGSIVKQTLQSHTAWVTCARWSTTNEHLLISGAYDNLVKLWDTRSPRAPLYDMTGHTDKILCCDWSQPQLLVTGGADHAVRVFSAPS